MSNRPVVHVTLWNDRSTGRQDVSITRDVGRGGRTTRHYNAITPARWAALSVALRGKGRRRITRDGNRIITRITI